MNTRALHRQLTVAGHVLTRTEFHPTTWIGAHGYKICMFRKARHNGVGCWEAKGGFKASPSTYYSTLKRAVEDCLG